MNDNTNTNNPLPITMDEPAPTATPEAEHHVPPSLINVFLSAFEKHIDMLVETKFAQLVENHKTMALMDENMKTAITEMIDDAICTHEVDHDHPSDDEVHSLIDTYVTHSTNIVRYSELTERVADALDDVLEERMRSVLDNADISISI